MTWIINESNETMKTNGQWKGQTNVEFKSALQKNMLLKQFFLFHYTANTALCRHKTLWPQTLIRFLFLFPASALFMIMLAKTMLTYTDAQVLCTCFIINLLQQNKSGLFLATLLFPCSPIYVRLHDLNLAHVQFSSIWLLMAHRR